MAAMMQELRDIPHVTPIMCPACKTGKAPLVERRLSSHQRDSGPEVWVFKCDSCGAVSAQPMES